MFYWFLRLYAIFFYFKLLWIIVYICHNLCTVKPVVSRSLRDSWKCRSSGQAGQEVKALLILRLLRSPIRGVSPVTLHIPVLEGVLEPGCSYQVGIHISYKYFLSWCEIKVFQLNVHVAPQSKLNLKIGLNQETFTDTIFCIVPTVDVMVTYFRGKNLSTNYTKRKS